MDDVLTREIVLHVTDRPDGGLRVLSDDVKGLFLGGAGFVLAGAFAEGTVELWRDPVAGEVRLIPELDGTGAL